jgi:hypothetical protein
VDGSSVFRLRLCRAGLSVRVFPWRCLFGCDSAHKSVPEIADQFLGANLKTMQLSAIWRILDENQAQPKMEQPKAKAPLSKTEEQSGLKTIEMEIATAAELAKPSGESSPIQGNPSGGPFLEELLRAITKFEKSDQSRVVDVFE